MGGCIECHNEDRQYWHSSPDIITIIGGSGVGECGNL